MASAGRFSCSLDEPISIGLAAFMPETEAADRLVISALIPCDRHSHGFQSRKGYFRHVIGRFTFVQLLYSHHTITTPTDEYELALTLSLNTFALIQKHLKAVWKRRLHILSDSPML